jgi:DHA2 family multidrug resistance protein
VTLFLVYHLIEDPPFLVRLKKLRFDYIGFALLTLGVGALQVFLDKGQEDDWFGSHFITTLVIVSALCLTSLVIWEWRQKEPIVDVRLFKSANFSASCLQMFVIGVVSFASIVLMPQFLQMLVGYTASSAGLAVSMGALVLFVTMPTVGLLMSRVQARYLLAVGWVLIAGSMFFTCAAMSLGISFNTASWVCVMQRIPVGLIYIPGTLAAYFALPQEKGTAIAGLVNFVRNIGSSVGTSFVTTMLARRAQVHQDVLASAATVDNFNLGLAVKGLAAHAGQGGLDRVGAYNQAFIRLYAELVRQATAMSFVDAYWLLGVISGLMFFSVFFVRRNNPKEGSGGTV